MPCKSESELIAEYGPDWQNFVTIHGGPFNSSDLAGCVNCICYTAEVGEYCNGTNNYGTPPFVNDSARGWLHMGYASYDNCIEVFPPESCCSCTDCGNNGTQQALDFTGFTGPCENGQVYRWQTGVYQNFEQCLANEGGGCCECVDP